MYESDFSVTRREQIEMQAAASTSYVAHYEMFILAAEWADSTNPIVKKLEIALRALTRIKDQTGCDRLSPENQCDIVACKALEEIKIIK